MTRIIPTDKARQGHRGRHLLPILILALLLTVIVWAAVEIYAETIARRGAGSVSTVMVPFDPSGAVHFAVV